MSNIVVYGGRMGSSFRPHWMLAELGLSYETKKLDMTAGEHKGAEYMAINPASQIPSMVHDGFVITESAAIVHFLAEKYNPSFFGKNDAESHATMLRWQLFVLLNLDKNFATLAGKTWGMPATPEMEAKCMESIERFVPVFEGWLAAREYVMGDIFTVADIVTRSSFNYAEAAELDLSAYPSVMAWMARCAARPAYIAAKQG